MAKGGPAQVEVTGALELRKALRRMGDDLSNLKEINRRAAETVADRARDIVPVVSGSLALTIKPGASQTRGYVSAGNNTGKTKKKSAAERGGVPYAGPIHFGWPARNIEAQPFLYHALDDRATRVVDLYEARIEALVVRVGRDAP